MRLVLLVAVTMIAFAANSLLNRFAVAGTGMGPMSFAAIRLAAGAVMLSVLILAGPGGTGRLHAQLSVPKAAALALYMLGFSLAYRSLDAGIGALLLFGGVQLTMFAGAVRAGEAIPLPRWIGAGIAFCGLAWLLWPRGAVSVPPAGAALMLAAAVGWGLYSLMGRGGRDPLAATAGSFVIAAVPVTCAAMLLQDGMRLHGAVLAIVSGAVTSGLGYALWYTLLPKLDAAVAAVAQLTVPPIAIAGGALILGEPPGWRFLLAASVVLGGVLVAVLGARLRKA